MRRISSAPSMPAMRALPCALSVRIGICQPCQDRASTPIVLQRDRQQAGGHLLAGRDHGVVFARVVQRRQVLAPGDQLVGDAGHGGDHDGDLVAGVDLALHAGGDVADAVEVGDRGAAELHHDAGHRCQLPVVGCQWSVAVVGCRRTYWRRTAGATMPSRSTVSPDGGGAVRRAGGALVGSGRADAAAAPDEPGADRLDRRRGSPADGSPAGAAVRLLDVGCGAGLAAEALARRGFDVLGLDAAGEAIEAARAHAAGQGLPLAYRAGVAEDLLAEGLRFPVITALEVIEHVPDPAAFLRDAGRTAGAGRAAVPLHAEPHAARRSWRPRSAPNTCCAGCRSARMTGASSSRPPNWAACCGRWGCAWRTSPAWSSIR